MKRAGKIFLSVFVLVIFALNLSFTRGSQDSALYLDSTKFKPALDLIKDDPNFSITIGIIDGKEYLLTVKNKVTGEETNSNIMQSSNADFEDYCLNVLGIDLHTMLGVKLSEKQKEGTVIFDKCDINGDGKVNVADIEIFNDKCLGGGDVKMCDFNEDGKVDVADLEIFNSCALGETKINTKVANKCDINRDGKVDVADVETFNDKCLGGGDVKMCDLNEDGKVDVADLETFNEICLQGEILNTDNCEKVSDYPLDNCPEGALCSFVECGGKIRYRLDGCQTDYKLKDGICQCDKQYTNRGILDGRYECSCPYLNANGEKELCSLFFNLEEQCWGDYCTSQRYSRDGKPSYNLSFMLDDVWAKAMGINNIDDIWVKERFYVGDKLVGILDNYMRPEDCESLGQKYFTEKGKEVSATYHEDKVCTSGCWCSDLDNCPENMKIQCLKSCGNKKKESWESCTSCPQDFGNECMGKKIVPNHNHLTPDDLMPTLIEPKEEKCDKNPDYSLTACPTGAICSYADCGDRYGYKIESCQNDYEFKDGACKCHKQLHIRGELAGRYSCSMCHSEWGGNMCTLDVKMESMCTEYENGSSCSKQNYTAGGVRMYDIYFFLGFEAADALGIDSDRLAQTKTLLTRGDRLHYGYRNGEDTEHDFYNHDFYMTEKDCKDIGEKYFGSKSKGKEIDLPNGYSDNSCKQDCTGFDLNVCPENKKCLVCGGKFKVVGDQHENKGWKCYKISDGMEESDECDCDSYVNKSKDGTWVTSEEPGCSVDTYMCQSETTGEKFYSGVCGGCNLGYEMKEPGKCEYIPCGADFWMEAQMNIACPEDAWKFGITCNDEYMKSAKEFVPMNGCTQAGKQFCEKHYGSDSYVGNQKWLKGFGYGDERDGCRPDYAYTYFKCTECESGYTLKNGACVADSGIGSIYYYKGDENKPIGIVFEETDDTIKIVSLQDLGGIRYDYSKGFFTPHGTYYFWEDAMAAVKQYAPNECETGSFCGKGKWRIPTREEMLKVSKNFADGGSLVQAIRGLEASCSKENSMNLLTHRYWTSTSVIQHTNVESVYGGADIDAAYVIYHPIANDDYPDTSGKKNSIQSVEEYARPVLTIYK